MTDVIELRAAVGRLMYSNQKSSADYDMLINFIEKATELIDVAAKCMDDCDYAMTKVSNSRVEEAVSTWNAAYNHFKGGADDDRCEGEKVTIRSIETIVTDYGEIQIVALNVGGEVE